MRKFNSWLTVLVMTYAVIDNGATQPPWSIPYGESTCGSLLSSSLHTGGEIPVIGNSKFKIFADNIVSFTLGFIYIASKPANMPTGLGINLYVEPHSVIGLTCLTGLDSASLVTPIPNDSSLVGAAFFAQGVFFDTSTSYALVNTNGLKVTLASSIAPAAAAIYDRLRYQSFFSNVTSPGQADSLGKSVWAFHQIQGFQYLRTELFSSGGQSHWMIVVLHDQTGMEFTLVPGGSFRMGNVYESYLSSSHSPLHRVNVPPLLVARTEVTQAQFATVTGTSPWLGESNVKIQGDHAANYINWFDAQNFCSNTGLRLPTEAEWEYSCRAGVDTCFSFGVIAPPGKILDDFSWYIDTTYYKSEPYPHPVGIKNPNAFGLHDVHGNVFEWCVDTFHDNYNCSPSNGAGWIGSHTLRVLRGGGWFTIAVEASSLQRIVDDPTQRKNDRGFRPVRSL